MTTKLGVWPTERYYLSWVTQKLINNAPEQSHARRSPASVAKQILNPIAQEEQRIHQSLVEERDNIFPSAANIDLLDHLYEVDLKPSLSYTYTQTAEGSFLYDTPRVYVSLNNTEYEITQAKKNNIETLSYTALPSRLEDGETSYTHTVVIPTTTVADLVITTPNDPVIEGHLYITLSNNTNWEYRLGQKIYYAKIFIKGKTRKGTEVTEAIPLRYNGTFKTINQWKEIEEVFISYLDSTAFITIDAFPWYSDGLIDKRNLAISEDDEQKWRWITMGTHSWGNTFVSEAYGTSDFDLIRKGIDEKNIEQEIELLDANSNNLTFDSFTMKPYSDYMFATSGDKLYVYNIQLPYPDVKRITDESPDVKMDLYADKWIFARDESATIKTRILSFQDIPYKVRWKVETPSEQEYYMDASGALWPTTTDQWIENLKWDEQVWLEQQIDFTLSERGTYIVTLECLYFDDETDESKTLETKYLFYVPYITPEVTLDIPNTITSIQDISFDSDGKLWVLSGTDIYLLDVFYDYFLADYERDILWLREQYSSVRIEI